MDYAPNDVICKCRNVTLADIDRAVHEHETFSDVEREFAQVQQMTSCSTGCGRCHDKIMGILSGYLSG